MNKVKLKRVLQILDKKPKRMILKSKPIVLPPKNLAAKHALYLLMRIRELGSQFVSTDKSYKDEFKKLHYDLETIKKIKPIEKEIERVIEKVETQVLPEEVKKEISDIKEQVEIQKRWLGSIGGGNANRRMRIGGTEASTKYTDINLIAGSGVAISTANDDTDKEADITFSVSGLGTSIVTPAETPDGSRTTFTVASKPKLVFVDGGRAVQETSSDGTTNWSYSGTTLTMIVAPTFDIFALL